MKTNLQTILDNLKKSDCATATGTHMHSQMRTIIIDGENSRGPQNIINQIKSVPNLVDFFTPHAQTEVPIAGYVENQFISRRIDRVIIHHATQEIRILDYKTDTDRTHFFDKYAKQISEYKKLVADAYPGYTVRGFILWLHDFSLQEI